jgi:hypothetical protein
MIRSTITLVLGIALFSAVNLQAAQPYAACGDCGYGAWGSSWWGGGYSMFGHEGLIPHYALYPPVYYSLPVPRTYGYSPFAYPPTVMTPEVVEDKSETIINPHVPAPDENEKPTAMRVTSTVRIIANPYVVDESSVAAVTQ